jgi:hypothetical protein
MGHVDYSLSAPFSSFLPRQPAFSAQQRTFNPVIYSHATSPSLDIGSAFLAYIIHIE